MTCTHLQQLYQLCEESQLKLSSSDLIHIVCKQCSKQEVCPSVLVDEYDALHPESSADENLDEKATLGAVSGEK